MFVSQCKYVSNLLHRAGMSNCNAIGIPLNSNEKLKSHDNFGDTNPLRYKKLVGGLLYPTHTHLDNMYAMSVISRFMQSPSLNHLRVAKRILRYISGIINYGIHYSRTEDLI